MRVTLFLLFSFCCILTTSQAQIGSKSIILKPINLTDSLLSWKRQNLRILNPTARFMTPDYSHQHFGVNFTRGLRTLLLLSETKPRPGSSDAYIVSYKYCFKNIGIRAAYGFDRLSNKEERGAGIVDEINNNMDAKLGVEYRFKISSRWHYALGVDGLYFNHGDKVVATTEFDVVTTTTNYEGFGVAPFASLQFNLNRRLAFITEAGYNFLFGNEHIKSVFEKSTDLGSDKVKTKSESRYNGPLAVFLIFKF
jgi:hypothetical protein